MLSNLPSSIVRAVLLSGFVLCYSVASDGQTRRVLARRTSPTIRVSQPSAKPIGADEGVKQLTIAAYEAAYSVPAPDGQLLSQELAFRLNEVGKLNLRNVDPDLIVYFRLLEQQYTESIAVLKPFEADMYSYRRAIAQAEFEEERYDASHLAWDEPPDRSYLLRLRREWGALEDEGVERLERIKAKYVPSMNAALNRLTAKYQYPFDSRSTKLAPATTATSSGDNDPTTALLGLLSILSRPVPAGEEGPRYPKPGSGSAKSTTHPSASRPASSAKGSARNATEFYQLGQSYNEQSKFMEAVEPLKSALRLNPNYVEARAALGYSYQNLGRCDLASDEYKVAVRLRPESLSAQYGLGWCHNQLKQYNDAIVPLRQVIRLDPNHSDAHLELGYALTQTEQYNEGIEQYQIVIRQKPDYGLSHYYLGQAYLAAGNRSGAQEQYRILKRIDTEHASKLLDEINNRKSEKTATKVNQQEEPPVPETQKDSKAKKALKGIWNQIKIKKPN